MKFKYNICGEDDYYCSVYIYDQESDPHNKNGILVAEGLFEDEAYGLIDGINMAFYGIQELIKREGLKCI